MGRDVNSPIIDKIRYTLEQTVKTMKFSAFSVAAIFALSAQIRAEPLATPTGTAVATCPTHFDCGYFLLSFFNPCCIHYLFLKVAGHV